jgi:hypothetical protein
MRRSGTASGRRRVISAPSRWPAGCTGEHFRFRPGGRRRDLRGRCVDHSCDRLARLRPSARPAPAVGSLPGGLCCRAKDQPAQRGCRGRLNKAGEIRGTVWTCAFAQEFLPDATLPAVGAAATPGATEPRPALAAARTVALPDPLRGVKTDLGAGLKSSPQRESGAVPASGVRVLRVRPRPRPAEASVEALMDHDPRSVTSARSHASTNGQVPFEAGVQRACEPS